MRVQRMLGSLLAILVIAFGPLIKPHVASAAPGAGAYSQSQVIINGGGGILSDGSDGISMWFNRSNGGEKLCWRSENFYYSQGGDCTGGAGQNVGFSLNVGGTAINSGGFASATFDSLTIGTLTGTADPSQDTATGNGSAVLTYTKDIGGAVYVVERFIEYEYPNTFYTEQFTVTIPAEHDTTKTVKLYKGGDTAPGGSDSGRALLLSAPVRNIQSIEPTAGVVLGMREISQETGMSTFEGAVGKSYSAPYGTVASGGDIGFEAQDGSHDVGFMIQYTIGNTPGTYTEQNETYVGNQAVNLTAAWSSARVSSIGRLNFTITNAFFDVRNGLGFVFTVPSPLTVGDITNGCSTATVDVTGSVITVTNIDLAALSSCVITVDVGRPTAGSTSISASNVTVSGTGLVNAVGSSTVTFTAASPTFTPRPTRTRAPTATSSPTFTSSPTATNTATATNTFTPTNTMTPTPHPFAIKDVAVGASFTLGVLHNGTLVTWGFNRAGQASLPRWMATKLVDQVETGSNYAIALGTDGRVYGWGANDFGQMTIPTQALSGVRSISANLGHVMAIKTNGDLVIWGRNDFKQREAPLAARKGLSAVGAGHSHSLAVKGGKVIAWGRNTWGQTNVPRTLTGVIAVSGGFDHSLALRSNGTVVCWGRNNENQCKIPNGLTDVISISAGVGYSLALTRDGMVFGWGRSNYGQSAVPAGLGKAGAISAGYVNSVIGMRDASVVAFGDSSLGALVSRTPTVTP